MKTKINDLMCIRSISKKELAMVFGCYNYSRREINSTAFRRKFMTDQVIKNVLGISPKEFSRIRVFSFSQTQKIVDHFKIEKDELQELQD